VGPCEHGNAFLGSIKGGEFLGDLSDYQFLKKGSAHGAGYAQFFFISVDQQNGRFENELNWCQ
jgi:hypothetical protein